MVKNSRLTEPDTLIVLTFAKAGLGHLRVAYALMEGLPSEARSVLFSSTDTATTFLHRLTSTNPLLRELGETMQYGVLERIFTSIYTKVMRLNAKKLLPSVEATLSGLKPRPKKVIFVATHFGLAHQLGELKDELLAESEVDAKLVVVVTDDSPQRPWFVPQADLTIVPSKMTQARLSEYARNRNFKHNIKVAHYPLSLKLAQELGQSKLEFRLKQADHDGRSKVKVSVPVSGAAVGLDFFRELTLRLSELEPRFHFYITSRASDYTKDYLAQMALKPYASVYKYEYDRLVVSNYNKVIHQNTISFEITKPSEQAFKALYTPRLEGGVILLLTSPVGRQEYDNLWYLERNNLIPKKEDQEMLWQLALNKKPASENLKRKAKNWRGIRIPKNPQRSAEFIVWCLREGIFMEMMKFNKKDKSEGVNDIWGMVDALH